MEHSLEIEIWYDGKIEKRVFSDFPVRIGRDAPCELFLPHAFISRRHARIERGANGRFLLVDDGGRNGVSIGGTRLAPQQAVELVDGAEFTIEGLAACVRYAAPNELATSLYADRRVVPEMLARAAAAMDSYRAARVEALAVLTNSLAAIPEQDRAAMATQLVVAHGELVSDPEFRKAVNVTRAAGEPQPTTAADEAFRGLYLLAAFYAPSAPALRSKESVRAFLRNIDWALRTFLVSKGQVDAIVQGGSGPSERARELGQALLDWRNDAAPVAAAIEGAFAALATRNRKLTAQAEVGARAVLAELAPSTIQAARPATWQLFGVRARWDEFARRHAALCAALERRRLTPVHGPPPHMPNVTMRLRRPAAGCAPAVV